MRDISAIDIRFGDSEKNPCMSSSLKTLVVKRQGVKNVTQSETKIKVKEWFENVDRFGDLDCITGKVRRDTRYQ